MPPGAGPSSCSAGASPSGSSSRRRSHRGATPSHRSRSTTPSTGMGPRQAVGTRGAAAHGRFGARRRVRWRAGVDPAGAARQRADRRRSQRCDARRVRRRHPHGRRRSPHRARRMARRRRPHTARRRRHLPPRAVRRRRHRAVPRRADGPRSPRRRRGGAAPPSDVGVVGGMAALLGDRTSAGAGPRRPDRGARRARPRSRAHHLDTLHPVRVPPPIRRRWSRRPRQRLCLPADRDDELASWLADHPPSFADTVATIRWPGEATPDR